MNELFYKAGRALLGRTDMTDAEKIIQIVRTHFLAFEKREPTTAELVKATGKCDRTIRRAKTDKLSALKRTKCPDKMSAQADKKSAPSCKHPSVLKIETQDRGIITTSSPFAAQGEETASSLKPQAPGFALLHLKAVEGGGKWTLTQWIGQVEEDEAARRYTRAELAAFVAGRTAVTEAPWRLAESVRRHADAARAAAFAARLRTIRAEGLTDARQEGAKRLKNTPQRARVTYVDPDAGEPLLVLAWTTPRIPGSSYGPQAGELRITDPTALAAWTFRARQPALPFAESQTGAKA